MAKNNVVHMRDVKGVPKYNAQKAQKDWKSILGGFLFFTGIVVVSGATESHFGFSGLIAGLLIGVVLITFGAWLLKK